MNQSQKCCENEWLHAKNFHLFFMTTLDKNMGEEFQSESKQQFHLIHRIGKNQSRFYHQIKGSCHDSLQDAVDTMIEQVKESISCDYYSPIYTKEETMKIVERIKKEKKCMLNDSHRKGDYNAWWISRDAYDHLVDFDECIIQLDDDMRFTSYFLDWARTE